jgi:hypothetical protein
MAVWAMDETFGTTMADSSGHGNNGTTYNVVTSGGGYVFNGTTSKVVVPSSATLNPGTQDFSYSVQVQTDRIPPGDTDYDLLRKGLSSTKGGEYKVEIINSNGIAKASCVVKDGGGRSAGISGTTNLADGALHTLTCSKTATRLTLKVDSLPLRTKTVTNPLRSISNSVQLLIGAKSSTGVGATNDWYTGVMRSATVSIG